MLDLRETIRLVQFEYFVICEMRLDHISPSAQFKLVDYKIRTRRDRYGNRDGITEYVRKGVSCKRLKEFHTTLRESIYSELTISSKKWNCMSMHPPPLYANLLTFFEKITLSTNETALKYESFIIAGQFNIDINYSVN